MVHDVAAARSGPRTRSGTGMGGSKDVHLVPAPDDSTAVVAFQAADRARCQQREDEEPDGHDGAHLRASTLPAVSPRRMEVVRRAGWGV